MFCEGDAKSVVDIPFRGKLLMNVGEPKVVGSFPLKFFGDDRNAAQCWGDLVPDGGTSDLSEAHVHDSEDSSIE